MQHLSEIVEEARKKGKKRLAVAYGQDAHTLAAVYAAYKEGLVEPILFGDPKIIEQVCKEENIDCNIFKIIPESNDVKCVNLAVNAVVTGEADVLMKGLVSTDKYMRGILNKDAGPVPPERHVEPRSGSRNAELSQVTGHLGRSGDSAARLQTENHPDRLPDAHRQPGSASRRRRSPASHLRSSCCRACSPRPKPLCSPRWAIADSWGNVVIDGPLSLDVALYKEAAEIKKVKGSSVAGDADCLLFPNIESGNVFFKASTHMGGGEIAAMVMGTKVPCVLTSRGDSSLTKLYSIALACLAAK